MWFNFPEVVRCRSSTRIDINPSTHNSPRSTSKSAECLNFLNMQRYLFALVLGVSLPLPGQGIPDLPPAPTIEHPITEAYLRAHPLTEAPPLLFRAGELPRLRERVTTDSLLSQAYATIRQRAEALLTLPPVERVVTGRRLLSVSREALKRISTLGLVYLVDQEPAYADRMGEELLAVAAFEDWNPSHFLDVAEMSVAVAIGLNWGRGALSPQITAPARRALLHNGLLPALNPTAKWRTKHNNWNQVCNAGAIAAALVLADEHPARAARLIALSLGGIPEALRVYAPDGVYPEGPTYWSYGTGFTVLTIEMLRSAFGSDFGIANSTGFLESARFLLACKAPSDLLFSFGDSKPTSIRTGEELLGWFAHETGRGELFRRQHIAVEYSGGGKNSRIAPLALTWLARLGHLPESTSSHKFAGRGGNPVFILRDTDVPGSYFAAKGGYAAINHGNMDAGSFVFETDSIRWAVDPGNQPYHPLESRGVDLWGREQSSERWTLLSKNSEHHNTLTVNGHQHRVDGFAALLSHDDRSAEFDLTKLFAGNVRSAIRTFDHPAPSTLIVADRIQPNSTTESVTWRMLTQAEVTVDGNRATLRQAGKQLYVDILEPARASFSVISADPPPLEYDLRVPGLKRLEIHLPGYTLREDVLLRVRLSKEALR